MKHSEGFQTEDIEQIMKQEGRVDVEEGDKAETLARSIKKDMDEGIELGRHAAMFEELGLKDKAEAKRQSATQLQNDIDTRLTHEGILADIQSMNSTQAGQFHESLRQRIVILDSDMNALKELEGTVNGKEWERVSALLESKREAYQKFRPYVEAASKQFREQSEKEFKEENESGGPKGRLVDIGSSYRAAA